MIQRKFPNLRTFLLQQRESCTVKQVKMTVRGELHAAKRKMMMMVVMKSEFLHILTLGNSHTVFSCLTSQRTSYLLHGILQLIHCSSDINSLPLTQHQNLCVVVGFVLLVCDCSPLRIKRQFV